MYSGVRFYMSTQFNTIRAKKTNEEQISGLLNFLNMFQSSVDQNNPNAPLEPKKDIKKDIEKELYYGQGFPFFPNNTDGPGNGLSLDKEISEKREGKDLPVSDPEGLIEMLFIQRSLNENDRHSGQIAFPGGRCDGEENDKQASEREAFEEVFLLTDPVGWAGTSGQNKISVSWET